MIPPHQIKSASNFQVLCKTVLKVFSFSPFILVFSFERCKKIIGEKKWIFSFELSFKEKVDLWAYK